MVHNNWLYREAENPDENLAGAGALDQESAALSLVRLHMVPHSMPQDYIYFLDMGHIPNDYTNLALDMSNCNSRKRLCCEETRCDLRCRLVHIVSLCYHGERRTG